MRLVIALGVGVFDFDFQRLAFVFGGDAVGLVGRTDDINAIALPLIFDAALFQTVRVAYFSSQRLADFGVTANADVAFLVRLWLWCCRIFRPLWSLGWSDARHCLWRPGIPPAR